MTERGGPRAHPPRAGRVAVKICGCRSLEDVEAAVAAGADLAGFVFAPSPRRLEVSEAAAIAREVRGAIRLVGVFVDAPAEAIRTVAERVGLEVAQLHGSEARDSCLTARDAGLEVWKALRPRTLRELAAGVSRYRDVVDALLVEGYSPEAAGGTGTGIPPEWLTDWRLRWGDAPGGTPALVLAGGLTPDNVAEAIRRVRPDAVDVSSGVERAPGTKDAEKVRRFVARARRSHLTLLSGGSAEGSASDVVSDGGSSDP